MERVQNITSMVRVKVDELKKELIIVNRDNEPSEFITIDKNNIKEETYNEQLKGYEEMEEVFNIPCTYIEL